MDGSEKKVLSIEDVVAADDVKYLELDVPEWGGTVKLGSLSAGDLIEWHEANEGPAKRNAGLRLLVKSFIGPDGKRLADPNKHIETFRNKDNKVLERLLREIVKLNGLTIKGQDDAKNSSGEVPGGASPTVLH